MTAKKTAKIYNIDQLPSVMTLKEAGLVLGYTDAHLRQMSLEGQFPGFQLFENEKRCSWRVMKQDLLDWLDERRSAYLNRQNAQ